MELSPASLRLRFFPPLHPHVTLADPYLDPDWSQRGALIATLKANGVPTAAGVAGAYWTWRGAGLRAEGAVCPNLTG